MIFESFCDTLERFLRTSAKEMFLFFIIQISDYNESIFYYHRAMLC
jgi:hypothetical protein